jgi:hypothetical protein
MTGIEPAYSAWEAVSASGGATIRVPEHRSAMYPTAVSQQCQAEYKRLDSFSGILRVNKRSHLTKRGSHGG